MSESPGGWAAAANTLRNVTLPGYFRGVPRKAVEQLRLKVGPDDRPEATAWCAARAQAPTDLFAPLDPELWRRAAELGEELAARGAGLSAVGTDMAGDHRIVYFLVRHLRPTTVVETGVAAGYTSAAILRALADNGAGHLWSSDFPFVRHRSPTRDIGILVDDELRPRWTLLTAGDRANLPEITAACGTIDLFHYDSDKSVRGRERALATIWPAMAADGVVVVDDIGDNLHFRDWTAAVGLRGHVVPFGGKYLGVVPVSGSLAPPADSAPPTLRPPRPTD